METKDSTSIPSKVNEGHQKTKIDTSDILQEDVLFHSPAYTVAFIIRVHANGLMKWKIADKKTKRT